MKKHEFNHQRVFSNPEFAQYYFKKNGFAIRMTGKRLADVLAKSGFTGGSILDAGCGFCAVPIQLAKRFPDAHITAIDLSVPLTDLGKKLIGQAGVERQIEVGLGDVQRMEFEDKRFDVVINSYLLHVVESPVAMCNEIERIAKPDARIILTDLRRNCLGIVMRELRTSFTLDEAIGVISQSHLRAGKGSCGPFWWDYRIGLS